LARKIRRRRGDPGVDLIEDDDRLPESVHCCGVPFVPDHDEDTDE
jgi:hypothetical protein